MSRLGIAALQEALENVSRKNPIEYQFVREFETTIEEQAKSGVRTASTTFKPSSLGGCERNLYFQLTGVQPKVEEQSSMLVGICESGTDRHIRIQEHIIAMKEHGYDCEYIDIETFVKHRNLTDIKIVAKDGIETKCYNKKYNMSFMTDGIIKYKGQYYILEIKTETDKKFKEHDTYRPEHKAQGIAYYLSFGISQVLYLYENRNNTMHKAFIYEVTDDDVKEITDKMEYINTCVENGELPPKTKYVEKCRYCNYKVVCEQYD